MITIPSWIYQQYDADQTRPVPAEGYGGWRQHEATLDPARLAIVSMHAWHADPPEMYPGWDRAVEYRVRSSAICREVYPRILGAARGAGIPVLHVVGGTPYYTDYPGYKRAVELAGPAPEMGPGAVHDPSAGGISELRRREGFPGAHNVQDITRGFVTLDFAEEAKPVGDEGIAEDAHQLNALCREAEVSHLVYIGFALNWCLLMSPGSMLEMKNRGYTCSTIRQAVTAVENRESAATEAHKEEALWRTSLSFGLVFDDSDFITAIANGR